MRRLTRSRKTAEAPVAAATYRNAMNRFRNRVVVMPSEGGFAVLLDDRPLRTPAGARLILPGQRLARIVAREWSRRESTAQPELMPATRLCNFAIDRADEFRRELVDGLLRYGSSDLLCYRAENPPALRTRQARRWNPVLAWSERELGAPLAATAGVVPVNQPATSLAALRRRLEGMDGFRLSAMRELVTLSGSLLLGLAVEARFRSPESAWRSARLDEDWQREQWGEDAEASELDALRRRDFLLAARILRSLDQVQHHS